jgi:hypothetical protein
MGNSRRCNEGPADHLRRPSGLPGVQRRPVSDDEHSIMTRMFITCHAHRAHMLETFAPPTNTTTSGDYAELKRLVQARGLLKRQYGYYVGKFAITGGLLGLALAALIFSSNDPWIRVAEAAFLAFVVVQIGLLAHDLGHKQIVGAGRLNTFVGLILGNFLMGVSRSWWRVWAPVFHWAVHGEHLRPQSQGHAVADAYCRSAQLSARASPDCAERGWRSGGGPRLRRAELSDRAPLVPVDATQ